MCSLISVTFLSYLLLDLDPSEKGKYISGN